ncbi:MAG: hypothetical protein GF349_00655 [Candidatus Magasanikbacteria bacterium]|nr:hypothetical protein [Candidatus Magasanikbacteria bacterium]
MNLYEFEAKQLFEKYNLKIPTGVNVRRGDDFEKAYQNLGVLNVVLKAQVLSGKRGKNSAIRFCSSPGEVKQACKELFAMEIKNQYVAAVRIEEKLDIDEEHYLSITYDTCARQPVLVYSHEGGIDIENVKEEKIKKQLLDIRISTPPNPPLERGGEVVPYVKELWDCFLGEDCRLVEINPLVKTSNGEWIAADAKIALDEDAFYRHKDRSPSTSSGFAPRSEMGRPPTEREIAVKKIDEGEKYYQGTAGKYIEMDGEIAVLFSGGGASIANMDALMQAGLKPANYTEYSGNPPRKKVYELAKIVLSKPGLKGLWIAGGVANFTDVAATFGGIVDALDELKPNYPIVIRRAGPNEEEGIRLMQDCAKRNNLKIKIFGKETPMSDTAKVLAGMVG